jgi:protein TonB
VFDSLLASRPGRTEGSTKATAASIVIHAVIIVALIYAPAHAALTPDEGDPVLIPLPQNDPLPPPTVLPPTPPPTAVTAPTPLGFTAMAMPDVVPPDIPPPQVGVSVRAEDYEPIGVRGGSPNGTATHASVSDEIAAPFMTPMDVRPKLINRDDIAKAIGRNYPPMLRDAGVTGTTTVWFYIDETGKTVKQLVKQSSGFALLDSAAMRVAPLMKFSPAKAQDKAIPVWVGLDIQFTISR